MPILPKATELDVTVAALVKPVAQVNRDERTEAHVAGNVEESEGTAVGLAEERQVMSKSHPFVDDRLLTVGEVAGTMRVSNMTVYRLIKSGQLPAFRVGKNYRIREHDLEAFLATGSVLAEGANGRGAGIPPRRERP